MRGSGFLLGTSFFLYLKLKNEEVKMQSPFIFLFPKARDIYSPNLLIVNIFTGK